MIGAVLCSTFMSQQCKQQWTERTASWSASILCGGTGGCVANPDGLVLIPVRKSRIQLQGEVVKPSRLRFDKWLCWMLSKRIWKTSLHNCPFCTDMSYSAAVWWGSEAREGEWRGITPGDDYWAVFLLPAVLFLRSLHCSLRISHHLSTSKCSQSLKLWIP